MQPQVLGANLDTVFMVSRLDQELSLRRIERYLAVVWAEKTRDRRVTSSAEEESARFPGGAALLRWTALPPGLGARESSG